jgi:prepilin-type N-terminal cleavage/methylation domain-containing protein
MKPSQKSFTLLELLVVITIIGILSSIVIVSMSGSTDSAAIAKGKTYAQQVYAFLGSNAVGVWSFDEETVNTCSITQDACDISGYNNHGTFVGDTYYVDSDIEGYALSFDGTGDYVDCGNDSSLNFSTKTFTIGVWGKVASTGGNLALISKASYADGWIFYIYSNNLRFGQHSDYNTLATTETYNDNTWHYFVVTRESNDDGVLIVDGVEAKRATDFFAGRNVDSVTKKLTIGAENEGSVKWFNGLIDEVRVYTTALSPAEIQMHYVQGLEKLLANQAITQVEYDQRMEEFNQFLASSL